MKEKFYGVPLPKVGTGEGCPVYRSQVLEYSMRDLNIDRPLQAVVLSYHPEIDLDPHILARMCNPSLPSHTYIMSKNPYYRSTIDERTPSQVNQGIFTKHADLDKRELRYITPEFYAERLALKLSEDLHTSSLIIPFIVGTPSRMPFTIPTVLSRAGLYVGVLKHAHTSRHDPYSLLVGIK